MEVFAVIGANYGDEGKGLVVDSLADSDTLVVRHNGGAQAGHTVVTPEGTRHIFSHVGSGALQGAATFLADSFICNPDLFVKELEEPGLSGITPVVYVHPFSRITTPVDILLNQAIERQRGVDRHGSCGLGINETVTRCLIPEFRTVAGDLMNHALSRSVLDRIVRHWLPIRIDQLGIRDFPTDILNGAIDRFYEACTVFMRYVHGSTFSSVWPKYRRIIFEGAQGLALDEHYGSYPHVTRSRTGLTNPTQLCSGNRLPRLEAIYVTRTYLTRHGAGPFPGEDPDLEFFDDTNNDHEFQGCLRFGHLNYDELAERIVTDLHENRDLPVSVVPHLAITHVDQLEPQWWTAVGVARSMGAESVWTADGPTREHLLVTEL